MTAAADRHLLFGLLALQNGLIDQGQLVAAFQAWTLDKSRSLADHLEARGDLTRAKRALLEALADLHLEAHDGDVAKSLAAVSAGKSTREGLARIGDPDVGATLDRVASAHGATEAGEVDRTTSYAVGSATGDGQRFRVLRPHARGGLGAVFVALDAELNREVALKQILDRHADDPVSRQRFLLEAEITGGLEHPGIVPVYGLGTYDGGRPYYAMRFIKGDSLKEAIERYHGDATRQADPGRRSLELRKLLRRFTDVCNAIDYAHSRGILHRDIKPGNIIVGRHGETLVVDWGLAKATGKSEPGTTERTLMPGSASGSAETLPGSAMGTPAYMSPEQARGDIDSLGPRSDVYSLGATLYCLLTGKPPLEGDDIGEVLRKAQQGEFPSPRQIDPTLDRALEAVCLKAMAVKPEDRYASCRALAEDVERWMADVPVSAWHEPWTRTLMRWLTRHRTGVTGVAAAVLAGVVGLVAVLAVQATANARLSASLDRETGANKALAAANEELTRSRAAVQARYDLAVDAIKTFHTGVSEDFLLKQDQFKELRDRLLRDAVVFYRKLEGLLTGQVDARSRRALGRAYEEVGELTGKIGSIPEALAAHGKALEVRRGLAREATSDAATKADVGKSLIAIGILLVDTGDDDEAMASFGEAHSLLARLAGPGPARDEVLDNIARSSYWAGWASYRTGKTRESMAAYEEARAIEAELAAAHPEMVDYSRVLSWCDNDIAILLMQEGKTSEALAAFERSRRVKQKIADDHRDVAEYRRALAISHSNIGILLREAGNSVGSLASNEAALALWQQEADAHPSVTQFQVDVANGSNEIGQVLRMMGRRREARASYLRSLAILEERIKANPSVTETRERLMEGLKGFGATQLADGRTAEAVATWRRAVAIGEGLRSSSSEPLYCLAGCYALLGGTAGAPGSGLSGEEGSAILELAMTALRRAAAAGYRSVDWIQRDPDLDALRSRTDYKMLIMDLAMPPDPFDPAR